MEIQITIESRYLNFPVRNGAAKELIRIYEEDRCVREFDIELAESSPDFWVFTDMSEFIGKKVRVVIEGGNEKIKLLEAIVQDDFIKGGENLYREKYRPQFHFSSRRGWLNDPNGLVYYRGEYHLFYQHNPYGCRWGNMHWGHAVSRDLLHWEELPVALYPKEYGDFCFSGSAVVDWNNTAGFQVGDDPTLIAYYTSTGRGQCMVYSNNKGRTWTEYEGNPTLVHGTLAKNSYNSRLEIWHDGRDPKVFWHDKSKKWVMVVYEGKKVVMGRENLYFGIYTSNNLKDWNKQSEIEGWYECPELFELPVDGDKANTRWVMFGADGRYAVGSFDGSAFIPKQRKGNEFDPYFPRYNLNIDKLLDNESYKYMAHYGDMLYAAQTYNDIPCEDGRRVYIGWMQCEMPDMPFNQMMSFPCELALKTTEDGIRMFIQPVREIEKLHKTSHCWEDKVCEECETELSGIEGDLFDIRAEWQVSDSKQSGLIIRGIAVLYDKKELNLVCKISDEKIIKAPLKPVEGSIKLQVLVDRTSIEIYANEGRVYMPIAVIPNDNKKTIKVFSRGGRTQFNKIKVYELVSIW